MRQPFSDKSRAVTAPMPAPPPVIRTRRPAIADSFGTLAPSCGFHWFERFWFHHDRSSRGYNCVRFWQERKSMICSGSHKTKIQGPSAKLSLRLRSQE